MKFLAFVDLHQDLEEFIVLRQKVDRENVDFIVCLGDFSWFGSHQKELLSLFNDIGKKIFLIHGNHESEDDLSLLSKKFKHIQFVHNSILTIDSKTFVFHGGGGFSSREPTFKKLVKDNEEILKNAKALVLATHAPPYGTVLDLIHAGTHVGVKDYVDFIKEFNPLLAISGHIHESSKKREVRKNTLLCNPGGDGEIFVLE